MKNQLMDKLPISPIQLKVFVGTFLAIFIMTSLQYLGVHSPWKVFPVPLTFSKETSTLDKVKQENPQHLQLPKGGE